MNVIFGTRLLFFELLCILTASKNTVFSSEGVIRECCEPVSPTPSYLNTEFPSDYFSSTELGQSGKFFN